MSPPEEHEKLLGTMPDSERAMTYFYSYVTAHNERLKTLEGAIGEAREEIKGLDSTVRNGVTKTINDHHHELRDLRKDLEVWQAESKLARRISWAAVFGSVTAFVTILVYKILGVRP